MTVWSNRDPCLASVGFSLQIAFQSESDLLGDKYLYILPFISFSQQNSRLPSGKCHSFPFFGDFGTAQDLRVSTRARTGRSTPRAGSLAAATRPEKFGDGLEDGPRTGEQTEDGERKLKTRSRVLPVALLAIVVGGAPGAARADSEDESASSRFFWGLGSGICTLVYTPLKVAYAASAIPLGGLVYTWSVGDAEMAGRVIGRATAGNFVVTPDPLKGNRSLDFIGKRGSD